MVNLDDMYCKLISCFRKIGYSLKYSYFNNDTAVNVVAKKHQKSSNPVIRAVRPLILRGGVGNVTAKIPIKHTPSYEISLRTRNDGVRYISIFMYLSSSEYEIYRSSCPSNIHVANPHCRKFKTILVYENYVVSKGTKPNFFPATIADFKLMPDCVQRIIFSFYANSTSYNDFISDSFYIPIKLEALSRYYNKHQYFKDHFGVDLPESANDSSLNKLYTICCVCQYILPGQISVLLDQPEDSFPRIVPNKNRKKRIASEYIFDFIAQHHNANVHELSRKHIKALRDYIDIAISSKCPIDINISKDKFDL